MSANAETQTPQQPVKKSGKRKRLLLLLTLLFIIIAVAIGIYWFLVLRHFEETDDAYVAGNQIQIMSQVSGSVTKSGPITPIFVKATCWSLSTRQMLAGRLKKPKLHWLPAFAKPTS